MKAITKLFVGILLLASSFYANAQGTDSLIQIYQSAPNDSAKMAAAYNVTIEMLNQKSPEAPKYALIALDLAEKVGSNDDIIMKNILVSNAYKSVVAYDKAVQYGNEAIKTAERLKKYKLLGRAYQELGGVYYNQGDYTNAEKIYLQSLEARKLANDATGIAASYNNLGGVNNALGNYEKSTGYFIEALKINETANNEKGIAMNCNNLSIAYRKMNRLDKALEYQLRSLKIKEKIKDTKGIAYSLGNIANIYYDKKDTLKTIQYYKKVLSLEKDIQDDMIIANAYNSLGVIYRDQKKYEPAIKYLNLSLSYKRRIRNETIMSTTYSNLGVTYLAMNEIDKAEASFKKALEIAKISKDKDDLRDANDGLAMVYAKKNDLQKSLDHLQEAEKFKDSIYNIESSRAVTEMQTKYETEKKETSIKLLQKENELKDVRNRNTIILSVSIVAILLISSLLAYLFIRFKQQQKTEEANKRMEQQRLDAIILAQEEERKRISAELHDSVGQMLSAARLNVSLLQHDNSAHLENNPKFEAALSLLDRSCQEVRSMSHNMMPGILVNTGLKDALQELVHSINSSGALKIKTDTTELDKRLAPNTEVHLYRIIQEVLNNIIRHSGATEVQLQFQKEKSELRITIEDNGKGFNVQRLKQSKGNGWNNIQTRLYVLKGDIEIDSQENRKGTVVFITIPLNSANA